MEGERFDAVNLTLGDYSGPFDCHLFEKLPLYCEDDAFTRSYLDFLNDGFAVDPEVLDVFAQGLADIPAYCNQYLGTAVHSWRGNSDPVLGSMVPEYPAAPDAEKFDAFTISEGCGDGALWFRVQELVEEGADSIDVWYAAPARHLVADPADGGIAGVIAERDDAQLRVQATSGVVLACGGFENNQAMIQDFCRGGQGLPVRPRRPGLRAFDSGPYYAPPGVATVLNTQGGPRRNAKAQVIGANGEPIARLYSASELGSVNAFQYQGGCNLSECLIFGKIAGEGAAGK